MSSPSLEAGGVKVKIEGSEAVGAIFCRKDNTQCIAVEGFREGGDFVGIEGVYERGDDDRDPCRGFGEAAKNCRIVFRQKRLEKTVFPIQ